MYEKSMIYQTLFVSQCHKTSQGDIFALKLSLAPEKLQWKKKGVTMLVKNLISHYQKNLWRILFSVLQKSATWEKDQKSDGREEWWKGNRLT